MEDHVGPGQMSGPAIRRIQQIGKIAANHRHAGIGDEIFGNWCLVNQRQPGDGTGRAASDGHRAAGEQFPRQARAQEAGPARDHHVRHGLSLTGWPSGLPAGRRGRR
jgi:hypothetical protein